MELFCFLIDDDADDQEIFMMAIGDIDRSIRCVCAYNSDEALEKLNVDGSVAPHYIFVDMNMPKVNGIDCLKELKKIDHLKQVPIYMYSTSADPKFIAESKKFGAVDFIVKPHNIRELTNILSGLLGN